MSYSSVVEMGDSQSLLSRVAACAAGEGNAQPRAWAANNLLNIAARPAFGFAAAWDYAKGSMNVNKNPDIGAHDDVINDSMILSAVQALKNEQAGTQGWS